MIDGPLPFGGKLAIDMRAADEVCAAMMDVLQRLDLDRQQGMSAALGGLAMLLDGVDVTDDELEGVLQAVATLREALADGTEEVQAANDSLH